jgi:hypothetical protein
MGGGPSDGIMRRDGWAPVTVEFAFNFVLAQSSAWDSNILRFERTSAIAKL